MNPIRIKAVCFDFDGIMFNTEDVFEEAGTELLAKRGHELTMEVRRGMTGRREEEAIAHLIEQLELSDTIAELRKEARETFLRLLEGRLAPMPGLFELLELIEGSGLPKGVATSSDRAYLRNLLGRYELASRFNSLMAAEDVDRGKPHPEIYLKSAAALKVDPAEMLVLEDSENGVNAASAAGAYAVAVPNRHTREHDFSRAHFIADGLGDRRIADLIDR
ncbi:HAD family hydrolase [Stratiformator vulcanicus]|uniref:Phosphorylated carbohydrates phosphatase n=1 Tax=Stratiformator vulcanicus TaxID=2527980 RepID=A0A517R2D8_9PLAN|nr:HAD family phosphatase [Stratiformator vulcanicus]QDT38028.1 Phosphorylated carbohydrates phosphatase [Stratiformator vulcanicus]